MIYKMPQESFFIFYNSKCSKSLDFLKTFKTLKPIGNWTFIEIINKETLNKIPLKITTIPCVFDVNKKKLYKNEELKKLLYTLHVEEPLKKNKSTDEHITIKKEEVSTKEDEIEEYTSDSFVNKVLNYDTEDLSDYYINDYAHQKNLLSGGIKKNKIFNNDTTSKIQANYEEEYNKFKQIKEKVQENTNSGLNGSNIEEFDPLSNDLYKFKGNNSKITDINSNDFNKNMKLITNAVRDKYVNTNLALKQLTEDRKLDIIE
jgi:hypothetical protein